MNDNPNPIGLNGIEFVEFASDEPARLRHLFRDFGFSRTMLHRSRNVELFEQGDIHFLLNVEPGSFGAGFARLHGPCISAMGWRVRDAELALAEAVKRGARPCAQGDYHNADGDPVPAVYGIGDSLLYFIEKHEEGGVYRKMGFRDHPAPERVPEKGFLSIDHLTNNVHKGTMGQWSDFYKKIFGFTEIRYFDIRGVQTGLQSFALRSPCGKFCIPINEATEKESQINEFIRDYKGPGIQHLALATDNIMDTVASLKGTSVQMLDIDDEYYRTVFDRVPNVKEDHKRLQDLQILVDGDDEGYLLQIFTRNLIGPIFIEIIQRKNHFNFGEGNFGALFRSIERDQKRRGVL